MPSHWYRAESISVTALGNSSLSPDVGMAPGELSPMLEDKEEVQFLACGKMVLYQVVLYSLQVCARTVSITCANPLTSAGDYLVAVTAIALLSPNIQKHEVKYCLEVVFCVFQNSV